MSSLVAAAIGPTAKAVAARILAGRGVETPLVVQMMELVVQMRGPDYPVQQLWKDAEYLAEKVRELDDQEELERGMKDIFQVGDEFGGEQ